VRLTKIFSSLSMIDGLFHLRYNVSSSQVRTYGVLALSTSLFVSVYGPLGGAYRQGDIGAPP